MRDARLRRPEDPNKGVWPTPDWLFKPLHRRHRFDLDAAASADNTKCRRFFDVRTSALERLWRCRAWWCNPPYGCEPGTWEWAAYARRQVELLGNRGCLHVPVKAETAGYQDIVWGRNRVIASEKVTTGPLKGLWYRLREPDFDVEVLKLRRRVSYSSDGKGGWFASCLVFFNAPPTPALLFNQEAA